ncbi:hypothetical protein BKA93DRAFT_753799 [Sparassis latifolia]
MIKEWDLQNKGHDHRATPISQRSKSASRRDIQKGGATSGKYGLGWKSAKAHQTRPKNNSAKSREIERSRTKSRKVAKVRRGHERSDASRRLRDRVRPGGLGAYHHALVIVQLCMIYHSHGIMEAPEVSHRWPQCENVKHPAQAL